MKGRKVIPLSQTSSRILRSHRSSPSAEEARDAPVCVDLAENLTACVTPSKTSKVPLIDTSPKTPISQRSSTSKSLITPRTPGTPKTPLSVKKSLSASELTPVKERDMEKARIKRFIEEHLSSSTAGALFVSGKPGTGKTACISEVFNEHQGDKVMKNCMAIDNPRNLYLEILSSINEVHWSSSPLKHKGSLELERILTVGKNMRLVVLDEIDQLKTKGLDVLQKLFQWPSLPGSRVILIGVSNILDFTNTLISSIKLSAYQPESFHFAPYTAKQIKSILANRMEDAVDKEDISFDQMALEFCARKTAAVSGDIRTAFTVCRRGIQMVEQEAKRLCLEADHHKNGSPTKIEVKTSHIQAVFAEATKAGDVKDLPLQQRVLICCAILAVKQNKPLTIGSLTDKYHKICPDHGLTRLPASDVAHICDILAASGVFLVRKDRNIRMSKVSFLLSEEDAAFHFTGKVLLGSILACGDR